jgi:hypothetical protein
MLRRGFAFACTVLLSGPALGAAGDVLAVIGDRVNVRSGPGTGRDVVMQVSRNQRLVEIARQGDWVHAEIAGTGARGWIHVSLVAEGGERPLPPAADPAPADAGEPKPPRTLEDAGDAAAAEPEPGAGAAATAPRSEQAGAPSTGAAAAPPPEAVEAVDLQRFRDSVAYLNSRSKSVGGVDLFTEVEPLGGGVVQVGATDAWADLPPAGQRSYAQALIERWAAATGRSDQLAVRIVDQGGQVLLEQRKP